MGAVTATLWGTGDPDLALANSHVYLEAAGHVVVAWLWLEQALATEGGTGAGWRFTRVIVHDARPCAETTAFRAVGRLALMC